MFEVIIIACIVAKIKGYKLSPLLRSWAFWPVLVFTVIFVAMQLFIFTGHYEILKYSSINRTIGLLTFLFPIIIYKRYCSALWGALCMFTGTILNKIVMTANGGKMPVFPTLSKLTGYAGPESFINTAPYDTIHILGTRDSKLIFLSDIFDVGFSIMSLGDLFVRAYAFIITYSVIKYLNTADVGAK